ncbi:hypothetical protein [Ferrovum sp.]|uniref:hypothetical protein n=1 Tax=Ferrovum sp. TaxID=2609467 RepID=UPI0026294E95|nr:hypothetical protein [Ferrovum sp.]
MIEKINRYPFVTAGIVQIAAFPFISDSLSGNIASMLLTVSIWLWAIEVNENKARQSRTSQFQDSRCTWVQIPKLPNDQLPTVMRISVHGGNIEHKNDIPVLLEGAVIGDARFVAYIEDMFRSHKQIFGGSNEK